MTTTSAHPPFLALPLDHPRPPAGGKPRRSRTLLHVPAGQVEQLRAVAARCGAEIFLVLLGGFVEVLHRYTGQHELWIGTAGPADEPLVLGLDLVNAPRFTDLATRLQRALHESRSLAALGSPQVQVTFTRATDRAFAGTDLAVMIAEHSDGIRGEIDYDADLFEPATIERLVEHYRTLLGGLTDPAVDPSTLPLLTDRERDQVLGDWNATEWTFPRDRCLHHLFEEQVRRAPEAIAVIAGNERVSYGELERRANQLAWHLRTLGVGPEVTAGICLERSIQTVVAILGVLKAGGAYVPLDPAYPQERLAFMLRDTRVHVLITDRAKLDRLPHGPERIVLVDRDAEVIARQPEAPAAAGVDPDNLAYVIFTSGSTGRPKGIALRHRGVVNNLCDLNRRFEVGPSDRVLAVSSFSFDMSVYEVLGTLESGGTIIVPDSESMRDPGYVLDQVVEHGVTVWNSAPALLKAFVDHAERAPTRRPVSIRLAILGGDWVPVTLPDRLKAFAPGTQVVVLGGATELSIHSTIFTVEVTDPSWRSIPYGRPMFNQRCYVLDDRLRPVPVGVPGELYLGGIGLARGYLGQPALTGERFIPDPFRSGERIYKTGDLVRWSNDGVLELLGRIDYQVKLRGFRVEVGEIEAQLRTHPEVREATVAAHPDPSGENRLVAYVVFRVTPDVNALRTYLHDKLPDYMVPAAFVSLASLPLSPNGKVDRKALPAPTDDAYQRSAYAPPRTDTEKALVSVWTEVLGVAQVGIHDSFFELGGYSLLVARAASRIREVLSVELPLRVLFDAKTVAALASEVDRLRVEGKPSAHRLVPVSRDGVLELSPLQNGLWFIHKLDPNNRTYNMAYSHRIRGLLDVEALRSAIEALIDRHEALRTVFPSPDGVPRQNILAPGRFSLPIEDLTELEPSERERQATTRAEAAAMERFDLASGPLLRARVLRRSADDHVLLLDMHHIVSDRWSMDVLWRELAALYGAFRRRETPNLPRLQVQYADYTAWSRRCLADVLGAQLAYWKRQLAGSPPLIELPLDHPRPPTPSYRGERHVLVLDAQLSRRLQALGQIHDVTLYVTMLAAFQTLLHRWVRHDDIVVGAVIGDRSRPELEGLIGCFVNTLVMRTDFSGNPTFVELLARVRDTVLGAMAHQDLPFEKLVDELCPERSLSYTPLFQVMFQLERPYAEQLELDGVTASVENRSPAEPRAITPGRDGLAKFDLHVEIVQGAELTITFNFARDLFDGATIERMANQFARLLEGIVARPERRVWDFPLLSDTERHRLLVEWNRPDAEYPGRCVHELFEEQARRTPDAIAVTFRNRQLTYRELDSRANQLAHRLRRLGVGPDVLVALCVERSLEVVIGLLAILKAGGAYVPLDTSYPADRIAFMLEDAAVRVIVTQDRLVATLPQQRAQVVRLDTDAADLAREPTDQLASGTGADNLAYVIYTSGSTGRPKGTLITHRNVTRLFDGAQAWYGFDERDVWTLFHSYAFDFSVWEIWGALLHGGRLVVVPHLTTRAPDELRSLLSTQQVTVLNQTPSAFYALADADSRSSAPLALRTVILGGEALSFHKLASWFERHGDRAPALVNMYGITETTVHVTYRPVVGAEAEPGASSAIGQRLPDLQLYILDGQLEPAPIGVAGELFVAGAGLARGYLNRPDLTALRFIPNPFGPGRLYRTGDLVRRLADGSLDYLGRIDQQVKIRGFRIELGEIEARLLAHPSVHEAVVVLRQDQPDDQRLVAYLVGHHGALDLDDLRNQLRAKLPEYMVPAAFVVLDALPLTTNGKLDQQALPAPEEEPLDSGTPFVAPRTAIEKAVAAVCSQVLKIPRVGVRDSFFDQGGHSLLVTRLVVRMRETLGIELSARQIFERPTIEGMVVSLTQKYGQDTLAEMEGILGSDGNAEQT